MTGLDRTLLSHKIYDTLVHEIVTAELHPGQRLVEADIAARLGVSRSPVRDALHMLVAEGLATRRSHSGCTVKAPTLSELREIYEVRAAVEATAAAVMAARGDNSDVEELREINEAIRDAASKRDPASYVLKTILFYQTLLARCGNRYLGGSGYGENLVILTFLPFRPYVDRGGMNLAWDNAHILELLLHAIEARDPVAAAAAARSHMIRSWFEARRHLEDTDRIQAEEVLWHQAEAFPYGRKAVGSDVTS